MKRFDTRYLWGYLLIAAGVLFLLQEMDIITNALDIIWGVFFAGVGGVFLYAYISNRSQWWTLIPGIALFGIAALILLSGLFPMYENWGGAIFLGSIGLGFWVVYVTNREMWWAVIPGGVLITLAGISVLDLFPQIDDELTGGIFFLGLGVTFALLAILPSAQGRMTWALIPAGILVVIGFLIATPFVEFVSYLWPVALILIGIYIIYRNILRRS